MTAPTVDRYPYRRDDIDDLPTMAQAIEAVDGGTPAKYTTCPTNEITLSIKDGTANIPEIGEVPLGGKGREVMAGWLSIPQNFLGRVDDSLQQKILDSLLRKEKGEVQIGVAGERGIVEALNPKAKVIPVKSLFDAAAEAIGMDALVVDLWVEPWEFRLDVMVPETSEFVGGDAKVGDITRAGLRFTQDRKRNLAPTVAGYFHRLVCTNGLEEVDDAFLVRGRANTVEEQLAELTSNGRSIMARSLDRIESFYDLRSEKVSRPGVYLQRICRDAGISPRVTQAAMDALADYDASEVTKFDIVDILTHLARLPKMKDGPSRTLESLGGELVAEHRRRCKSCFHTLDDSVRR